MKTLTYQLTRNDAVEVWLRHWQGEYQHSIAASFGVNQGRVCEVLKGKLHAGTEQIAATKHDLH